MLLFRGSRGSTFVMETLMPAEECPFITIKGGRNARGHTTPFTPRSTMTWPPNHVHELRPLERQMKSLGRVEWGPNALCGARSAILSGASDTPSSPIQTTCCRCIFTHQSESKPTQPDNQILDCKPFGMVQRVLQRNTRMETRSWVFCGGASPNSVSAKNDFLNPIDLLYHPRGPTLYLGRFRPRDLLTITTLSRNQTCCTLYMPDLI